MAQCRDICRPSRPASLLHRLHEELPLGHHDHQLVLAKSITTASFYFSDLDLDHGYGQWIDAIASSKLAVCTLTMFVHVANLERTDASQNDSRLQPSVTYLMALFAYVVALLKAIGVCFIVDGACSDMSILLVAWNDIKCEKWAVVSSISGFELLPCVRHSGQVSVFSCKGTA